MSGNTNFPTALDDDTSLFDVTDGTSTLQGAHHNNIKEAIKAIQRKIGIYLTDAPTALDYRIGNPTNSHRHDGASGQGRAINPSTISHPSWGNLYTFMQPGATVNPKRLTLTLHNHGSAQVGSNLAAPVILNRTMIIESVAGALRRGPSGATTGFIVRVGPTNLYEGNPGSGIRFSPGATTFRNASPPLGTYPSGAVMTLDTEFIGSSAPGEDLSVVLVFRE